MRFSGLKRLETGALVKDYEGQEREVEQAVQMCLSNVASEDPRFMEKEAPPLSEEFPEGTKLFFLGEHAYGVAAQVSATNETSLSVVLAVSFTSYVLCAEPDCSCFRYTLLTSSRLRNSRQLLITGSPRSIGRHSGRPTCLAYRDGRYPRSRPASW